MKRGRPKKQYGYLRVATRSFLEGTRCRTPEEAVLKGVCTLEGWADALRVAKEAQNLNARAPAGVRVDTQRQMTSSRHMPRELR